MIEVKKTKHVTLQQLSNMAANLREKFNTTAVVEITSYAFHSTNNNRIDFRVYVESLVNKTWLTWVDLQACYNELMSNSVDYIRQNPAQYRPGLPLWKGHEL